MLPPHEDIAERSELAAVLLGEYGEDNIYLFYPKDADADDLKTMWIRSPKSETIQLADQE